MKDNEGVLPLLLILVILGIALLFLGWIVIALTTKTLITVVLVGLGAYLIVRPGALSGLSASMKLVVPFGLILIGILFYAGVFSAWV